MKIVSLAIVYCVIIYMKMETWLCEMQKTWTWTILQSNVLTIETQL